MLFRLLLIGILFPVAGCGRNVSVYGKVAFPDGKPLTVGMVCFQNDKHLVRGPLRSDGTFVLDMGTTERGVLPGTYAVYVSGAVDIEILPPTKSNEIPKLPKETPLIDPKFMNPETSGISCEVVKGMKLPFDIAVDPPK